METINKKVAIIGMHRSGTSIVAKIVHELGVCMGDELLKASISNVDGHYEDVEFYELNNKIFNEFRATWDSPPSLAVILKNKDIIKREYFDIFRKKKGNWGFKEPRSTILLPAIVEHIDDFFLIYCRRTSEGVAKSLKARDDISANQSNQIKSTYDDFANFTYSFHNGEKIIIDYEELITSPQSIVCKIANILMVSNKELIKKAAKSVRKENSLKLRKIRTLFGEAFVEIKSAFKNPKKIFSKRIINRIDYYIKLLVNIIRY